MGWEVKNNRFFCNTVDEYFGPKLDSRVFCFGLGEQMYAFDAFQDFCKRKGNRSGDPRSVRGLESLLREFGKKWRTGEISHNPSDRRKRKVQSYRPRGKVLTEAIAAEFIDEKDWWNLFRFRSLGEGASQKLSKYEGEGLYLTGIKDLSSDDARCLSKFDGEVLELNGLKSVSVDVIAGLVSFRGILFLDGIKELSDEAAEMLAKFKGHVLSLNGIAGMSDSVAASLGKYASRRSAPTLCLNNVSELSDLAAEHFRKPWNVEFGGVRKLSVKSAILLRRPELIKSLKEEDAAGLKASLKKFDKDHLDLYAVKKIPVECARSLATYKGDVLVLGGVESLTTAAAENLVKYRGTLIDLSMLSKISVATAEALLQFNGDLSVCLEELPEDAANVLGQHPSLQ